MDVSRTSLMQSHYANAHILKRACSGASSPRSYTSDEECGSSDSCDTLNSLDLLARMDSCEFHRPLWGDPVRVDDKNANLVVVFPLQIEDGKEVENPYESARSLFPNETVNTARELERLKEGPVSASVYQNTVRNHFLQSLHESGFRTEAFPSVDGDEVFLKIGLDIDGEVIKMLAQKFEYRLPLADQAYRDHARHGEWCAAPRDDWGRTVPAYQPFDVEFQSLYQPFREIDSVRLTMMRVSELVKLQLLVRDKIAVRFFPAASYRCIKNLHDTFARYTLMCKVPVENDIDPVRNYFGEKIAFFFQWVGFYNRMLIPLAPACIIYTCRYITFLHLQSKHIDFLRILFTVVLAFWSQTFNILFARKAARSSQRWGMKDFYVSQAADLPSHNRALDRTWALWWRRRFVDAVLVLFCLIFVGLIILSEHQEERAIVTVAIIKIGSFVWGPLAGKLVMLQNHRTQQSYDDALTRLLCVVKIFCACFPFIYQGFVVRFENAKCGSTLESVARQVYCRDGVCTWPKGVSEYGDGTWLGQGAFTYQDTGTDQTCIFGCHPTKCFPNPDGPMLYCVTNCWDSLKYTLQTLYPIHVLSTLVFLLIPRILTSASWHYEAWNAKRIARRSFHEGIVSSPESSCYTFLQWQAKHHAYAAYEYLSWGGSYAEDFLEFAISFTLLTCFGILYPPVALFALLCHFVEYRLLAHRMVNITCRPDPNGAEGIGQWQSVFEVISNFGVIINVGLIIFFVDPIRHWPLKHQVIAVVIGEHFLFVLKGLANLMIDQTPEDVHIIGVTNSRFQIWIKSSEKLTVPADEKYSVANVDIQVQSGNG